MTHLHRHPCGARAQQCADLGHPGATYNPWHDCTWCGCGHACHPGNVARHITCCAGPFNQRRAPVAKATDPHQQEADRRRLADFLRPRTAT